MRWLSVSDRRLLACIRSSGATLRLCALVCAAIAALAWRLPASAQATMIASPAQLNVAATKGRVETRTLLLSATSAITGVQILALDLMRDDNQTVLPSARIGIPRIADTIAANGVLTVPVTLDLRDVPSGQFAGELRVNYIGGNLVIPVGVTIKDPPIWPLLALLVGVLIGTVVSAYRAQGQPRDRVLVQINQLRVQTDRDDQLAASFKQHIAALFLDAEAALQNEQLDAAQQAIGQAQTTWDKWRKDRNAWVEQFGYHDELFQHVKDGAGTHLVAIRRGLESATRNAPSLAGPQDLQQQLEAIRGQINHYLTKKAKLDELNELRNQLPPMDAEQVRQTFLALQQQLDALSPAAAADDQAATDLQSKIEQALNDARQRIPPPAATLGGEEEPATGRTGGVVASILSLLDPAPNVVLSRPESVKDRAISARHRLLAFRIASYLITLGFLAGAGFSQLYLSQPAFGADPWTDYAALLAWGFGAEATRAAIVDVVGGRGSPAPPVVKPGDEGAS